jgi:hypothetical protein
MSEHLDLTVSQKSIEDGLRRTLCLHKTGANQKEDLILFFDLVGDTESPAPQVLDGFLFAIIFLAMEYGRPLRVHGTVSRSALLNIAEFQSAWVCWRPEKYKRIDIIPDAIVDLPTGTHAPRAVSAFSGGVDGTFTAIRHKLLQLGNASYPLTDVLFVHGFDVPLGKPETFDLLLQRVRPLLDELGLNVRTVRTNLKETAGQYWEDSFAAQLAACLHNYSHDFDYALIGSGEPYTNIFYPWGSTPATDYLMSGDQMRLVLDGSAYTRTEKMQTLRHYPTALKTLKVCWEGSSQERNCGTCEKCVRTKLNLLAVGVADAPCFDEPLGSEHILGIRLINDAQVLELETILDFVKKNNVEGLWVRHLEKRIDTYNNSKKKKTPLEKIAQKILNFK